mmetsp:Transcript_8310/g.12397  ORF Transcript_8310/g.12397 Transcript_8310/m.12397 type:complete len:108 (-) Transcript_8310:99-422(-)
MQGAINQMQVTMNRMELQMAAERHNSRSRLQNSMIHGDAAQLATVRCEEVGPRLNQEPSQFYPADMVALGMLTAANLNYLEEFYGVAFPGANVAARRIQFANFIGKF